MKFSSFYINGKKVKSLYLDSKKVAFSGAVYEGPLRFTAISGTPTVSMQKVGTAATLTLQTSTDGSTWTDYTIGDTITMSEGSKIYWKAKTTNSTTASSLIAYNRFVVTDGTINADGDVNSLLNGTSYKGLSLSGKTYCYANVFRDCTNLIEANIIFSSKTLGQRCYYYFFYGCTGLTKAPELPATTLVPYCYGGMFYNCKALTKAPELPATSVGSYCYSDMFFNCTSLTEAPKLSAKTLNTYCYQNMFYGCKALTTAPELPATKLKTNCYKGMFQGCTSLTTAPELPATSLDINCYQSMFLNCTSLTTAPELPATTLKQACYDGMFQGCKALTTAPRLPATTLVTNCYRSMFSNCTTLTYLWVKFSSWDANTTNWLYNNLKAATIHCPQTLIDATTTRGSSTIPATWTMVSNDGD